jgi:ectoine hydroxylase-related dioxygenase (phytanoyl-CoA dioxygenase family)
MRSAYPEHYLTSGIAYAFHPHRDTWYSAPPCQINWWLPIWDIEERNCLAFYPRYFDEPTENSSEIYNYYDWNAKSRAGAAQHVRSDTRQQPKLTAPIDSRDIRILVPPGGLILFSAAHLHATVTNTSGIARYSIDFRTVHRGDAAARRGAPNIDSRCTGTTMRDYLRCSDLAHLPEEIVTLYDDGTALSRGGVVSFAPTRSPAA